MLLLNGWKNQRWLVLTQTFFASPIYVWLNGTFYVSVHTFNESNNAWIAFNRKNNKLLHSIIRFLIFLMTKHQLLINVRSIRYFVINTWIFYRGIIKISKGPSIKYVSTFLGKGLGSQIEENVMTDWYNKVLTWQGGCQK